MRPDHERLWFGPGGGNGCLLTLIFAPLWLIGLGLLVGLVFFGAGGLGGVGRAGYTVSNWVPLGAAAIVALGLACMFVLHITLAVRGEANLNRRINKTRPRSWWWFWKRSSARLPTTSRGVVDQNLPALGCILLIIGGSVACGCGPLVLVLLLAG